MELTKLDKKQIVIPLIFVALGVLLAIWDIINIVISVVNGNPLRALVFVVLLAFAVGIIVLWLSLPWDTLRKKILAEHDEKLSALVFIANSPNWNDFEYYGREIEPRFRELEALLASPNWPEAKSLQPFDFKHRVNW